MPDSYELVESALEHLWDYAFLGRQELVSLYSSRALTDSSPPNTFLDRGRAISVMLQDAIAELRAQDTQNRLSRERHYYDILYRCYVRGEKNVIVAGRLGMAERTFYRHRKRAIEVVARMLEARESDAAVRGDERRMIGASRQNGTGGA